MKEFNKLPKNHFEILQYICTQSDKMNAEDFEYMLGCINHNTTLQEYLISETLEYVRLSYYASVAKIRINGISSYRYRDCEVEKNYKSSEFKSFDEFVKYIT